MEELQICLSSLAQAVLGNCVNFLLTDLCGIWAIAVICCGTWINGTGMVDRLYIAFKRLSASAQLLSA